ncbi:MAG: S8 family serine peptidase [Thermoanaerobaculia bacterium]
MRRSLLAPLSLALLLAPASLLADWQEKVDPWVFDQFARNASGTSEFLIFLDEQADLSAARSLPTKLAKGTFVFETLRATAERSQRDLLTELDAAGIEHRSFWVANMIWARGDETTVASLAARDDVARIAGNATFHVEEPQVEEELAPESPDAVEWNIVKVNADDVWSVGFTGQGAVIGGQDTGYDWDHPALKNKYRGWNGAAADHNYSWHDSIHSGGGSCGANSAQPCDDHGHGTHTMGTMVGDDGAGNQIGMAPGAKWIGCRNMNVGNGTPTTYSECYQWFIAPTDLAGANPDPSKAPDVINNSWGCPPSEGCTDPNVMKTVVENLRAAGIFTAHSAGNSGSSCSTVSDPAAIYDASFTVGSTTSSDTISSFSSRGPVTVDGSNRRKPDISAPGSCIRSSINGGGYAGASPCTWSGTSMAGPHVAGLVALLISVDPALAGNVDRLEELIRESAFHPSTSSEVCGGLSAMNFPNNSFGFGRIDALAAMTLHQAGFIFRDGFETGLSDDWSETSATP